MSRETPHFTADARGLKFAVLVARFNSRITEKLLEGAREALTQAGAAGIEVFHVPGAFELPLRNGSPTAATAPSSPWAP